VEIVQKILAVVFHLIVGLHEDGPLLLCHLPEGVIHVLEHGKEFFTPDLEQPLFVIYICAQDRGGPQGLGQCAQGGQVVCHLFEAGREVFP